MLEEIIHVLDDHRTKLKIKGLDCLCALATRSEQACAFSKHFLESRINKIYYEMFLEKVEKVMPKPPHTDSRQSNTRESTPARGVTSSLSNVSARPRYREDGHSSNLRDNRYESDADRRSESQSRKGDEIFLPAINKSMFLKNNGRHVGRKIDLLKVTSKSYKQDLGKSF
jgi:hypothetical protein